ncbi:hypothetical protein M758_5G144300 [Ceratodon purpureus]|nr:hypothetical protein M758_5G144300 [Ceratodon purpureus]
MEFRGALTVLVCALLLHIGAIQATLIDNVAVQWNSLGSTLICNSNGFRVFGTGVMLPHLHLAQWHALLALKETGTCTTEEAVVAYASHRVLSHYFPFWQDLAIDPLLTAQVIALKLSDSQLKLAKRLGTAVALDILSKQDVPKEFGQKDIKDELNARLKQGLTPGLFSYHNNTPAGIAEAVFINPVIIRTFVVPDAVDYIEDHMDDIKPPAVPSDAWDAEYEALKDIGRVDWPGRTTEMNITAAIYGCFHTGHCSLETLSFKVARTVLPADTSLYNTVLLFAKIGVACHDATVVLGNIQWGYSFWRPFMAFRNGDPRHAPNPSWTPFSDNPYHPEYPSGTVAVLSAGMTTLQSFFGDKDVAFSLERGTILPGFPCAYTGGELGTRHYKSLADLVKESQNGRMYAGGHWNISVIDGLTVGARVSKYVEKKWGRAKTVPMGVLPDPHYMNIVAKQPDKAGQFSPVTLTY